MGRVAASRSRTAAGSSSSATAKMNRRIVASVASSVEPSRVAR